MPNCSKAVTVSFTLVGLTSCMANANSRVGAVAGGDVLYTSSAIALAKTCSISCSHTNYKTTNQIASYIITS